MAVIDSLPKDFVATITIHIDPEITLGPLTIAWHGLMIAVGIVAGGWMATVFARERGLRGERIVDLVAVVAVAGIVGARVFYLAEHGDLLRPGEWLGTLGFSIYGAVIFGPLAAFAYMRRRGLGMEYLDALAAGFPLGLLVGRVGDLINGEHFGPASDFPWAIRYSHPDALTPNPELAYHSGGLYEMALGLAMLVLIWPLRHRFHRPGLLFSTVIALYAAGRFTMFFYRSDSDEVAMGLNGAQWTSLALLALAGLAVWLTVRRGRSGAEPDALEGRSARGP